MVESHRLFWLKPSVISVLLILVKRLAAPFSRCGSFLTTAALYR